MPRTCRRLVLTAMLLLAVAAPALADEQSVLASLERIKSYTETGGHSAFRYSDLIAEARAAVEQHQRSTPSSRFTEYAQACLAQYHQAQPRFAEYARFKQNNQTGLAQEVRRGLSGTFNRAADLLEQAYGVAGR